MAGKAGSSGGARPGAGRKAKEHKRSRRTVTFDPDTYALIQLFAKANRISVSEAVNQLVADGFRYAP